MGLPFANGHYLALRHFPKATFAPAYKSVWHHQSRRHLDVLRHDAGAQSCARYFSSATPQDAVQCDIEVEWVSPWLVFVRIEGLLDWQIDIRSTLSTRLMTAVGSRLPAGTWTNRMALGVLSGAAGLALNAGQLRLAGTAPNGQRFMIAPGSCGRWPTPAQFWAARTSDRWVRCPTKPNSPVSGRRNAVCSWWGQGISRTSMLTATMPSGARSRLSE